MLLSQRIKTLRKQNNLTQKQLGDMVNVTKASICCYENGTRTPTLETLMDLANAFNVSINCLIGTDSFEIAENDSKYGMYLAREEMEFIKEIRKYSKLHKRVIEEPRRFVEHINIKFNNYK